MIKQRVLDQMITLHSRQLEELLNAKAQQEKIIESIKNAIDQLVVEVEHEKNTAGGRPELMFALENYLKNAKARMIEYAQMLTLQVLKLDEIIEMIRLCNIEIKKFEQLTELNKNAALERERKAEEKMLDELNIIKFQADS